MPDAAPTADSYFTQLPAELTAHLLARTLADMQASMTLPLLLHDAVALKRARGDSDVEAFKLVAREFGSGLNATVGGALDAMRQWTRKGCVQKTPAVEAFICDLQAIETGVFGRAGA